MIAYPYKCEVCGNTHDEFMEMKVEHPTFVKCPKCGEKAYRYYGSTRVHIPESFKAMSELYNGDNAGNFDFIKNRMNHGIRPSGKQKSVY